MSNNNVQPPVEEAPVAPAAPTPVAPVAPAAPAAPAEDVAQEIPNGVKMAGGKRKLTEWNKFVLKIFREHRKTNKKYQYGQALKEASALKKAGKMSMKKEPKVSAKTSSKKTKTAKKSGKKSIKCKKEYV